MASVAGVKRPYSSLEDEQLSQKRRVHRKLQHVQDLPQHVEPAPQDPVFAQGQLLRSISAALAIAGFDSVKPTALEMFRSHVEEYMLQLAHYARSSMRDGRRTRPVAHDFSTALSLIPNAATASLLKPQLGLKIPEDIACPSVPEPTAIDDREVDLSGLLKPLTTSRPPSYIPKHFPALPPRHTWTATPVFPEREKDARKMREKATQEGVMAEQALRKLATAAKAGALKAERRRGAALSGPGKVRNSGMQAQREDTFADVLKDIGGLDGTEDVSMAAADEAAETGMDVGMPEGVAVNYDMSHWRHGGIRKRTRT